MCNGQVQTKSSFKLKFKNSSEFTERLLNGFKKWTKSWCQCLHIPLK